MHIPDGFLDTKTIAITSVIGGGALAAALWHAHRTLSPARKTPLLGLSAAFVFAAQMVNFPVAHGTSGHVVGATLTAALLGPSAAVIVISSVLIVQCLLYGDGGITALGANITNMGLIGGVLGYAIYRQISAVLKSTTGKFFAAALASWMTTVFAAILCAGEVAASGHVPLSTVLPAMAGWHTLIGLGEATITVMVLAAVLKARPELVTPARVPADVKARRSGYWTTAAFGLLIALAVALFASPFASKSPDGLDFVAESLGFKNAESPRIHGVYPEYRMKGMRSEGISIALAGAIGTVVVFGGSLALAVVTARRHKQKLAEAPADVA